MATVKLDLDNKNDTDIHIFAENHSEAINANPNFPTPSPDAAAFDGAAAAYKAKLNEIAAAETALVTLRTQKTTLREALERNLTLRGKYVDGAADGDAAKILSAGFEVKSNGTPTTSLERPGNVTATIGTDEGMVNVSCNAVKKAKSYVIEYRRYSQTEAPGPWSQGKISTRSTAVVTGLASGTKYAFRVRALGPNDLESPWSDEAICMAP